MNCRTTLRLIVLMRVAECTDFPCCSYAYGTFLKRKLRKNDEKSAK